MLKKIAARRLSGVALSLGLIGLPLWLLSYIWIPFRLTGRETEAVWSFIVVSEIGAMIAGLSSIILGLIAFRYAERGGEDFRKASRAVKLGAATWVCLVVFNLVGIIFFS
jgi:hypothetical protein